MRLFGSAFVCAALLLAGCAAPVEKPGVSTELPPPSTNAVTRITAADKGKTVQVAVGKPFSVALVGVPTAGYLWKASSTPAFIKETGTESGPTTEAQKQPGFAGGNHWEVTVFVAEKPGRGELKFEQRRPWETNEPPADTFSVTLEAK